MLNRIFYVLSPAMNVFCPHFGGLRSLFQGNMTLGVDMAILKQLLGVMDYCYEYLWQKRDKFSLRPGALSNIFTDPLWWAKFHGKTFGGQSRADTHQYYAANRLVTLVVFQASRDLLVRWNSTIWKSGKTEYVLILSQVLISVIHNS